MVLGGNREEVRMELPFAEEDQVPWWVFFFTFY
jgi:hypothetical protein